MTTHWRNRLAYRPVNDNRRGKRIAGLIVVGLMIVLGATLIGCQASEALIRMRLTSDLDAACREANIERERLLNAMEAVEPGTVPDRVVDDAQDASAVAARRCGGVTEATSVEDLRMRAVLVEQATEEMRTLIGEFQP